MRSEKIDKAKKKKEKKKSEKRKRDNSRRREKRIVKMSNVRSVREVK